MAYRCDSTLLALMQEYGHTVRIDNEILTDDSMGGYDPTADQAESSVVCLIEDVRGAVALVRERFDVDATHIVYMPLTDSAGNALAMNERQRLVVLTPAHLAQRVLTIQKVQETPYQAAGNADWKGLHLELACKLEKWSADEEDTDAA